MDIDYHSRMIEKTHQGIKGMQYLDYKVLAQIMFETEPEHFFRCIQLTETYPCAKRRFL